MMVYIIFYTLITIILVSTCAFSTTVSTSFALKILVLIEIFWTVTNMCYYIESLIRFARIAIFAILFLVLLFTCIYTTKLLKGIQSVVEHIIRLAYVTVILTTVSTLFTTCGAFTTV